MSSYKDVYNETGFLELKSFFDFNTVQDMEQEIMRLTESFPEVCTFEDWRHGNQKRVLHKISRFIELSKVFKEIAFEPALIKVIEDIWEERTFLCTDKINFKLQGGRGFWPHQDMSGIWSSFVPNIISAFIAIDRSDLENGCLQLAPGHHKRGILGPKMRPIEEQYIKSMNFIDIIQNPGDVLLFDGFMPHKSLPNTSSHQRRILVLTYTKESNGDLRPVFMSNEGLIQ